MAVRTPGGGGAFVHPTTACTNWDVHRPKDHITWMQSAVKKLTLASTLDNDEIREACYPTRQDSMQMLKGDFAFPVYNPGFGLVLGVVYWLLV